MPTKYDVFAKIIEKNNPKQKDLTFSTPVYAHLKSLEKEGFIKKNNSRYVPLVTPKTIAAFNIIKKCLKTGLNYNLFLSKQFKEIINSVQKSVPQILSKKIKNNSQTTTIIRYLEENQFILLYNKRPKIGWLLKHSMYEDLAEFHHIKISFKDVAGSYSNIENEVLKIPRISINPFEKKYFENIIGSAQLEGSTLTIGETMEIIIKNIYPDKHHEEIQMVKNLNEAMRYVLDNLNEPISSDKIKNINSKVMFSLHRGAGEYKKNPNKIHGNPSFKTTPPLLVEKEIEEFCVFFNDIINKDRKTCLLLLGNMHNRFQRIHPFPDGNSRTTRIIINWMLLKFGFPLLTLKSGSFDKYMSLTKLAEKRYDDDLRLFFCHLLLHEYLIND